MNNKRSIIFSIIAISLVLLMVIGATFAYFQAQINDGASSEVAIDTDTVDILTFNASNDIMLEATQESFSREKGNISGTTTLNAHLIANNTNQTASYKYNVYLDITKNNFVYSTKNSTPEIVLVIKNPSNQYESSYKTGLGNPIKVDLNDEQVWGYDITTKIGLVEISIDYLIEAKPGTEGVADQDWKISVVLVNLDSNQIANAGKSFKAKAKVQSEKINVLDLGSSSNYYKSSIYKDKIKNVYFVNYINEEELNSVATNVNWDLSSGKDKSIMGWLKNENDDETAPYNLYIGSNLKEGEKIVVRSFANAFYYMTNLETVDLNLDILDTSNLNDTSYMFYNNLKLTKIIGIENLDVSNVTNMSHMFQKANLTTLDLSKWNTQNATSMSYMFYNYKGSGIIDLKNLDVSKVTDMSYMFAINSGEYFDSKITELDLSNWNTSSVVNMSHMFDTLTSLTTLNIGGWDTHNVTDMSHMFSGVGNIYFMKIKEIIGIEDIDVSKVTNMSYTFASIHSSLKLNLSKWNTSKVTNMSNMFYCANYYLSELNISQWDTSKVTDMSNMFHGIGGLTELDLSNWDTSNVTNMSNMFYDASSLTSLDMRKAAFSQLTNYNSYRDMFKSTNSSLKITITGDANKNWFIEHSSSIVLNENQLNVLPE